MVFFLALRSIYHTLSAAKMVDVFEELGFYAIGGPSFFVGKL